MFDNAGSTALDAGMRFISGDSAGAMLSMFSGAKSAFGAKRADAYLRENNTTEADVTVWSGCKDDQTVSTHRQRSEQGLQLSTAAS